MDELKKLTVVMLDITTYTGRKSLSKSEKARIGVDAPEDLMSVGFKKVIDPKEVAVFQRLKKATERACYKHGTRFLGGYAIEESKANELVAELEAIKAEYEDERTKFINSYADKVAAWRAQHAGWESMINDEMDAKTLRNKLRFNIQTFQVVPVDNKTSNLHSVVKNMGGNVLREIGRDANTLWNNSLQGREKVSQKVLRPLRVMAEKLKSLSFVDARLHPLATHIESVLASLPKAGLMDGGDLAKISGLVLILARGDGNIPHAEATEAIAEETTENKVEALAVENEETNVQNTEEISIELDMTDDDNIETELIESATIVEAVKPKPTVPSKWF